MANETKHTAGPWEPCNEIGTDGMCAVITDGGKLIAEGISDPANARLIASAPDLAERVRVLEEALRRLLEAAPESGVAESGWEDCAGYHNAEAENRARVYHRAMDAARAALAGTRERGEE